MPLSLAHALRHWRGQFRAFQVLSKFENFPTKKLEALRAATGLFTKLDKILNQLRNWKIESPIDQGLDKVERYFDKVLKHSLYSKCKLIIDEFLKLMQKKYHIGEKRHGINWTN